MSQYAKDVAVLRAMVEQYLEVANDPIQDERRTLWTAHNSLEKTRAPVLSTFGMWNLWCREVFSDDTLRCEGPVLRAQERALRIALAHAEVGDDRVFEPWLTQGAVWRSESEGPLWGVETSFARLDEDTSAYHIVPCLRSRDDMAKLRAPRQVIDEEATERNMAKLHDAVGDLIEIALLRGPALSGFMSDISTVITRFLGLDNLMLMMHTEPEWLHEILAFMRDAILATHERDEQNGNISSAATYNQAVPYARETLAPTANSHGHKRSELWLYSAAQEYTLVSPAMHDEFLLQYQLPIMAAWGLVAYGCCEDLTRKIDMLRQVPNLRTIAVTPVADLAKCAEQIGMDYAISWRPNPAEMVCTAFDRDRVRRIITEGMEQTRGQCVHIHLKDIETVEGEPERLKEWTQIVRTIVDRY